MVDPPLVPFLNRAERNVGQERRDDPTLWSPRRGAYQLLLGEDPGFQELHDQSSHLRICNATSNALHERVVVDVVEAALDVPFDDPLIRGHASFAILCFGTWAHRHSDVLHSAMAASSRPKPIRDVPKLSFEDWFQDLLDRALDHAV